MSKPVASKLANTIYEVGQLRRAVLALCAGFCAVGLSACDRGAETSGGSLLAGGVKKSSFFYRLQASYEWKETGEPFEFDLVVACNVKVTDWRSGGSSVDTAHEPRVMIKAAPDGGAVMIRTLEICNRRDLGFAPEKIYPMPILFDDVNDLSLGWGYASEDAFESPLSKLKFHGASVTRATAEDWIAWRETAEAGYEHKGMLPGPWGYSYSWSPDETQEAVREAGGGRDIANACLGYKRHKLPESVHQEILKHWPDEAGRYWVYSPGGEDDVYKGYPPKGDVPKLWLWHLLFDENLQYEGGYNYSVYRDLATTLKGNVLRDGSGFVDDSKIPDVKRPAPTYPLLSRSQTIGVPVTEPLDSYSQKILIDENRKGFLRCGGQEPVDILALAYYGKTRGSQMSGKGFATIDGRPLVKNVLRSGPPLLRNESFDLDFRDKPHPLYINDELADPDINPYTVPSFILDKEGYVLDTLAWGTGSV